METEKKFTMNVVQIGTERQHIYIVFPYWDRKEAFMLEMFKIIMVMIDECGSEIVVDTFSISSELDSDYLEVWEGMKVEEARRRYPEAMGFYFEDSRDFDSMVNEDVYSEVNGLKDARDNDEEWEI